MRKLLIITRDFPPYEGRGGVMRIVKFSKYLPEFGWKPYIICQKKGISGDKSLLQEIDNTAEVIPVEYASLSGKKNAFKKQIKDPDIPFLKKVYALFYRSIAYNVLMTGQNYFMAPDSSWRWAKAAIDKAIQLHDKNHFDALLASGPPFSTFRAGLQIKRKTGIPWILDFRDGWWNNPLYKNWMKKIISMRNRYLEKETIKKAQTAIFVCDPLKEIYSKRYKSENIRMEVIPNGFDKDDFANTNPADPNDRELNITFCGSIGGRRDPTPFLNALVQIKSTTPELLEKVRINFVGRFRGDKNKWQVKLGEPINFVGEVDHSEAIDWMNRADILLFISHESEGGKTVMSGKIYEYAALRKPILAIAHDCAATDFIKKHNAGFVTGYTSQNKIIETIRNVTRMWQDGKVFPRICEKDLDGYGRRKLAGVLSEELERCVR